MELPAYLQILSVLRARLVRGEWRVGDQIPTDEELMQQFGVSRFTVRAALDVLVADSVDQALPPPRHVCRCASTRGRHLDADLAG